jgi:hypothetical protein
VTDVESIVRTQLERLAPLPEPRQQDWRDVMRQAGSRRRRVIALAAIVLVLAATLLAAAPALGLRPGLFGEEPTPSWTWPEGLPGKPIKASRFVASINATTRDPVDLNTLREIASVGSGDGQSSLLAARGLNGDVCLAKLAGGGHMGMPFECLHDPPKPYAKTIEEQPVLTGMSSGGSRGSVVDYASLVGVTRSDVGRVELDLVDGQTIELPLNRWRGFGYYTTDARRFPKTLRVYRTWSSFFRHHEKLVGDLPLQQVNGLTPTPLCGGKYGPCPSGVKP